jgi:hypothetical protein
VFGVSVKRPKFEYAAFVSYRHTERRFLDVGDAEALEPNGFSVEIVDHDAVGRPVRFRPERPDRPGDAPVVSIGYDDRGNAVSVEFRSRDSGELVDGAKGFARASLSYDRFGDLQSAAYFTAAGKPLYA